MAQTKAVVIIYCTLLVSKGLFWPVWLNQIRIFILHHALLEAVHAIISIQFSVITCPHPKALTNGYYFQLLDNGTEVEIIHSASTRITCLIRIINIFQL